VRPIVGQGAGSNAMNDHIGRLQTLVVDDNEYMRGVIRTVLRAVGITKILEAESGAAAMTVLRENTIDLAFIDWMMQPMSGAELVRYLRTSEFSPNPYIPIIMVTAHTEAKNITEARDLGVTEFLAKPVTVKSMLERIIAIIERPRPFIRAKEYFGPDRRRQVKKYRGSEKRT
jgi:two-component system chemotaxis response regulator CheY